MEKATKLTLWLAGVLLLGLSARVLLFPVGKGPTGLVTFEGASPGSVVLFLVGLVLAGVLVFMVVKRSDEILLPEELRDTYHKLEELEDEIKRVR
jgi:hypothetical protein